MKKGQKPIIAEVRGEETATYASDSAAMAEIFKNAVFLRRGEPRGNPSVGNDLLDSWGADVSGCRTKLSHNEKKTNKQPFDSKSRRCHRARQ